MSEIQTDLSAPSLVTAIEANIFELTALLRHLPGAEVHVDPEMIWTLTRFPFALFNTVRRAQLAPARIDAAIETAMVRCKDKGVSMLWEIGPLTQPVDLGTHLEAHGFSHDEDLPGMAVDLHALNETVSPPPGLMIEQVKDIARLERWGEAGAAGYGMPDVVMDAFIEIFGLILSSTQVPLYHYTGWLDGKPVATSSLLLAAGVAGIYDVSTVPAARRQGVGAALTLRALLDARTMGYRVAILHASEMGASLYRKLGFAEYCRLSHYVFSPS
jgi:ribosomal protein S18 acetylase RimI-like enzyme